MRLLGTLLFSGVVLSATIGAIASSSCKGPNIPPPTPNTPPSGVEAVPASPQRPGDAAKGYTELLNAPYVACGIPASLIDGKDLGVALPILGFPSQIVTAPGRDPKNQSLPFFLTRVTNKSGVDLISTNCLSCHANVFQDNLVIGLGNTSINTTIDIADLVKVIGTQITDPTETAAFAPFRNRMTALSPHVKLDTTGLTAADNLAIELYLRRDPTTLQWKGDYQIPVPSDVFPIPVAVPPWWRMKKQHGMFSTGSFRGDHANFMYAASSLCIDDVSDSKTIGTYFGDVREYIETLPAPKYPKPIDFNLALAGERVFIEHCSGCHGTYGSLDSSITDTYPNLIVPIEEVGTDPALLHLVTEMVDLVGPWLAQSYYSDANTLVKTRGYLAPPLDGIWISAPYLHNDSVPTLEALLDSSKRPTYFTRSFTADDYDFENVGYSFKVESSGKVDGDTSGANLAKYDTTRAGYSNAGHYYGDVLTADERHAVIEYLKTL